MRKYLFIVLFFLIISCNETHTQFTDTKKVNTKKLKNQLGFHFNDFNELPKQKKSNSRKFSYSTHSIVDKESMSIENIGNESCLKLTLLPGQEHKQAKGYRAEISLVGG